MREYINKIETIVNFGFEYEDIPPTIDEFLNFLKKQPLANVTEVVRCKDCKYWQDNNNGYPHDECRWGKGETPDKEDFCSYGER